jgi:hypothetical protein
MDLEGLESGWKTAGKWLAVWLAVFSCFGNGLGYSFTAPVIDET